MVQTLMDTGFCKEAAGSTIQVIRGFPDGILADSMPGLIIFDFIHEKY